MRVTIDLEFIESYKDYDPEELSQIILAYIQELVSDGSLSYLIHEDKV